MGVVVGGVHILMAHPLAHKDGTFFLDHQDTSTGYAH